VIRLRRWIDEAGHEVKLIAPGDSDEPGFVSVGPATVIPANGAATPVALSVSAGQRVIDALRDVDVAHVHEPLMPQVSLAALRRAPVPMVGTFHADVSVPAGAVYRFGRPLTSKWFKRLDVITAVSPIAARVVADTGRVRVIPNGIDVEEYVSKGKQPGSVAFLGRNDERKGLRYLLAAWPQVRAAHPAAKLTVIGAEDPGSGPEGVRYVGRVEEGVKRDLLGRSSVFCAPNLSGESFGIVVVEAMAAGCAVVASGLPAFVQVAGDSARFVAPGDSGGIADAISQLLDDEEAAKAMGEAAAAASRRFGRERVAAEYLAAYEDALNV
jgi:phosphatidylinositol alpha-mannosyltransferase